MLHVYGIPNCNTVKKVLDQLKAEGHNITFHDFKKEGVSKGKLESWCKAVGWEALVNKKGTTWRGLAPEVQASITTKANALMLMQEKTSVIKRPVVEWPDGRVTVGVLLG
jgi:Spx/MgsR family transcriptional regulator